MKKTGLLPLVLALGVSAGAHAQVSLVARTPARHAIAPVNTAVVLTFSQPVTTTSAGTIQVLAPQSGRRVTTLSMASTTATLVPAADFKPGETVTVTVPATVQTAGGIAAAPHVYQFTTAATGGAGHFAFWQQLDTLTTTAQLVGVAPADVNGDGHTDLVSVVSTTTLVGHLNVDLSDGAGGYLPTIVQGQFVDPTALVVGDVDGDGDPDLLVAEAGSGGIANPCRVLFNIGSGTFTAGVPLPISTRLRTLTLGDLDADGDLDVVTGPDQTGNTEVLRNDGTGVFSAIGSLPLSDATAQYLVDLDDDGDLDLLHRAAAGSSSRMARNNGNGTFAPPTTLPFGVALPPCDLNADGNLDLVAQLLSPAGMQVHLGTNTGTFTAQPAVTFVGGGNQAGLRLALADADGDQVTDVVAAFVQGSAKFILARNDGTGTFTAGPAQPMPLPTPFVTRLVAADVDGDGDLDLLAPTSAQGALLLLRNAPVGPAGDGELRKKKEEIRVWPNPAAERAIVTWPAGLPADVLLLDGVGREVRRQRAGVGAAELDLRGLPPGLYTVRVGGYAGRLVVE